MKKKPKAKVTYAAYETADFLDNDTVIAEYLTAAAEDGNPELLLKARVSVVKAAAIQRTEKL